MAKKKNSEMVSRTTKDNTEALITVAFVVENDKNIAEKAIKETIDVLSKNYKYYELLIIDNGSMDGTDQIIKQIQKKSPNIRLLVLSRTYHIEIAFSAALDNSLGDYVVLMDINCDPPVLIPKLIQKAIDGYDVVVAERTDRSDNTLLYKFFARLFYKISGSMMGYEIPVNTSYFRVLSRRVVNSITKIKNKSRYLKYFNVLVGFKHTSVLYKRVYRKSNLKRRQSLVSSLSFAFDVIISNSSAPLRLAALIGTLASFLNLVFLGYVFIIALVKKRVAEGWISTSVMSATMFFLIFLILTIMSEYIARILNESKEQPLYFIAEESSSSIVSPEKQDVNVV